MVRIDQSQKLYPIHIAEKNVEILNNHPDTDKDEGIFRVVPVGNGKAYIEAIDPNGEHIMWF